MRELTALLLKICSLAIIFAALSSLPLVATQYNPHTNPVLPNRCANIQWGYSETSFKWCTPMKNITIKSVRKIATSTSNAPVIAILTTEKVVMLTSPIVLTRKMGISLPCLNITFNKTLSNDKDLICYDLEVFTNKGSYDIVVDCFQKRIETNLFLRINVPLDNKTDSHKHEVTIIPSPQYYSSKSFSSDTQRYLRSYQDSDKNYTLFRFVRSELLADSTRWHVEKFFVDTLFLGSKSIIMTSHFDSMRSVLKDIVLTDFYPFHDFWLVANKTGTIMSFNTTSNNISLLSQAKLKNLEFQQLAFRQNSNNGIYTLASYSGGTGYHKLDSKGHFKKSLYAAEDSGVILDNWLGDQIYMELESNASSRNCYVRIGSVNDDKGAEYSCKIKIACPSKFVKHFEGQQWVNQAIIIKVQDDRILLAHLNFPESKRPFRSALLAEEEGDYVQKNQLIENSWILSTNFLEVNSSNQSNTTNNSINPTKPIRVPNLTQKSNTTNDTDTKNRTMGDINKRYKWWFVALIVGILLLLVVGAIVFKKHVKRKAYTPEYAAVVGEDALI